MKRIFTTLILAALSVTALFAQQQTVVCGSVLDSLSRQGEPAAVVQFFKAPDAEKPIAFTTTDMDGNFCQLLPGKGDYTLLFTGVGRRDRRVQFTLDGQENFSLGEIWIQDDVQSLKSASVTAGLMHFGTAMDGLNSTTMSGGIYDTGFSYDGTTLTNMTSNAITASADYQHLWSDVPGRSFILSYQYSGTPTTTLSENTFKAVFERYLSQRMLR